MWGWRFALFQFGCSRNDTLSAETNILSCDHSYNAFHLSLRHLPDSPYHLFDQQGSHLVYVSKAASMQAHDLHLRPNAELFDHRSLQNPQPDHLAEWSQALPDLLGWQIAATFQSLPLLELLLLLPYCPPPPRAVEEEPLCHKKCTANVLQLPLWSPNSLRKFKSHSATPNWSSNSLSQNSKTHSATPPLKPEFSLKFQQPLCNSPFETQILSQIPKPTLQLSLWNRNSLSNSKKHSATPTLKPKFSLKIQNPLCKSHFETQKNSLS